MALVIMVIIGIGIAVVGGITGLRRLLFLTIAGIAGYAAVSMVRGCHDSLRVWIENHNLSPENATVISLILLTLTPIILIFSVGRKLLVRISVTESISETVDAILGSGYLLSIYLVGLFLLFGG